MKDLNSGGDFLSSQSLFIGRQDDLAKLARDVTAALAWDGTGQAEYRVLNWTGVGGVGKSELCGKMVSALEQRRQAGEAVAWAHLDLSDGRLLSDPVTAAIELRSQLGARGALSTPLFAYGLTMWSALQYPGIDVRAEYPELFRASHGEVTDDALSWAGDLAKEVFDVGNDAIPGLNVFAKYGKRLLNHVAERSELKGLQGHLERLDALYEATDKAGLRGALPKLLGADIAMSMVSAPKMDLRRMATRTPWIPPRFVILVDGADKAQGEGDERLEIDHWLEQIALHTCGAVIALFSRDHLRWARHNRAWKGRLQHLTLTGLGLKETHALLQALGVSEEAARNDIYDVSIGHPRVARVCASVYHAIKSSGGTPTREDYDEDADAGVRSLLARFPAEKQKAMLLLSTARNGVDKDLFTKLVSDLPGGAFGLDWNEFVQTGFFSHRTRSGRHFMDNFVRNQLVDHFYEADQAICLKAAQTVVDYHKSQIGDGELYTSTEIADIELIHEYLVSIDIEAASAWLEDAAFNKLLPRGYWRRTLEMVRWHKKWLAEDEVEMPGRLEELRVDLEKVALLQGRIDAVLRTMSASERAGANRVGGCRSILSFETDNVHWSPAVVKRDLQGVNPGDREWILQVWLRGLFANLSIPEDGEGEKVDLKRWAEINMTIVTALRTQGEHPDIPDRLEAVRSKLEGTEHWPVSGWHMETAIQKVREGKREDAELLFAQAAAEPFAKFLYTEELTLLHRCQNLRALGRLDQVIALCDRYLFTPGKGAATPRAAGFIAKTCAQARLDAEMGDFGEADVEVAMDFWRKPTSASDPLPCMREGEVYQAQLEALRRLIRGKIATTSGAASGDSTAMLS